MADSRPGTAEEKVAAADNHKGGFLTKRKALDINDDNVDEKDGNITTEVKPVVPEVPLISFLQLFRLDLLFHRRFNAHSLTRYSTTFEICLDIIGLLAAVGAGAAEVCTYFLVPRKLECPFFSPSCPCFSET